MGNGTMRRNISILAGAVLCATCLLFLAVLLGFRLAHLILLIPYGRGRFVGFGAALIMIVLILRGSFRRKPSRPVTAKSR
jgi:hypothetical protein